MHTTMLLCCLLLNLAPPPTSPPAAQPDSLDEQLLEGLGDGQDEGLPATRPPAAPAADDQPPRDALDEKLLDDLQPAGEESETGDPLLQLGRRMQQVQQRIGRAQADRTTQEMQAQIVNDLDAMIREAQRNAQQSSNQSKNNKNQGSQRSKPKPGQSQAAGSGTGTGDPGDAAAQESTERLGPNDQRAPNMEEMQNLMEGLWGQLPERLREQMRQSAAERFLPQYQTQIEQYFRRLVETPEDQP